MIVCRTVSEFREWRARQGKLGFVPTMGALHEGHLSLVDLAKEHSDQVAMSIFVNPTQFGPHEDFSSYPKPTERDLALAEGRGCDAVFLPTVEEMCSGSDIQVCVSGLSDSFEGALRPGHFDGVATIVAKLFLITAPDVAIFGWKDLQQCAVVTALVQQLRFPVELRFGEVAREPDGLAMSSRNVYLTPEQRALAPEFYRALLLIRAQCSQHQHSLTELIEEQAQFLERVGLGVDYLVSVDPTTLRESQQGCGARLMGAVRCGPVRLLDNIPLSKPSED